VNKADQFDHANFDEIGSRIQPPDAQISSKSDYFCWDMAT